MVGVQGVPATPPYCQGVKGDESPRSANSLCRAGRVDKMAAVARLVGLDSARWQ